MAATRMYVSPPIPLPAAERVRASRRATIEFTGVDQAGPSFEARVFLNNPEAGPDTPTTPEHGYAGSFHVYGYGFWPEREKAAPAAGNDTSSPTARLPMRRSIVATEAVLRAAEQGPTATVTVVPVVPGAEAESNNLGDALTIDGVSIETEPADGGDGVAPE